MSRILGQAFCIFDATGKWIHALLKIERMYICIVRELFKLVIESNQTNVYARGELPRIIISKNRLKRLRF